MNSPTEKTPRVERPAMRTPRKSALRLAILGMTFAAVLTISVGYAVRTTHDEAVQAAKPLYKQREMLLHRLDPANVPKRPFVAWVGDSTITGIGAGGAYPVDIARRVPSLQPWLVAYPGLEPFGYYFLTASVLEQKPSAVVLIANLRLLSGGVPRPELHLADLLPLAELPRAALLPLHVRGWTLPRLLLARLMRWEWYGDAAYFADGLRELWQGAAAWSFAGTTGLPPEVAFLSFGRAFDQRLRAYDVPIGESTPSVRMLGAAVGMATAREVPTLVVVTPIPWRKLERLGWYRRGEFAARVDAVRRVVEANGGRLLDLHRFMDDDGFRDDGGHFNRAGSERMADAVMPALVALLTDPALRQP
jgi:hypothetical protein